MAIKNKLRKLIKDPNRYFFDYFAKRIGNKTLENTNSIISNKSKISTEYLIPPGFTFDEKVHPWVQVSEKFKLRTGAITGHPDQSLLIQSIDLLDVLTYVFWIAHGFKSEVRIYTLGGGYEVDVNRNKLLNTQFIAQIYSKIYSKPDLVVEFLGEFDNNFACHFFIYDTDEDGLYVVRSNKAYVKKVLPSEFRNVYPSIINKSGDYGFSMPSQVDVVYTWVNKDDPLWVKLWNESFPDKPFDADRFASKDELKYSLRALCKFLPWFHKVYVVSNCAKPTWLVDHPRIVWVSHEEIYPDNSLLPIFNSHSIETCLHLIPNLSEHFIYFNDDVFVNTPVYYQDFFDHLNRSVAYFEPYGMVFENNKFSFDKDYLQPSINCQKLIRNNYPHYRATNLHRHVPFALNKNILKKIIDENSEIISSTRKAKLRTPNDINLTSFFYPHYASASGKGVSADVKHLIVRPNNINKIFDSSIRTYKFLCFNDGDGSANNDVYINDFRKVVTKITPIKCAFE